MLALNHNILCQNNFLNAWCADTIFLFFFSPFSIKKQLLVHKKFPAEQLSLKKKHSFNEFRLIYVFPKEKSAPVNSYFLPTCENQKK